LKYLDINIDIFLNGDIDKFFLTLLIMYMPETSCIRCHRIHFAFDCKPNRSRIVRGIIGSCTAHLRTRLIAKRVKH